MTRLARNLVGLGLLGAGAAALWLSSGERPAEQAGSTVSPGSQRVGRSTLSHGGPAAGSLSEPSGRLPPSGRDIRSDTHSDATTR
ncbi:conserved hypothetical protein [Nitrospira defluvii]|uniref:Uncharacterized protein n=1 Tax=Nitrospira defluvii TaxID=330214 RepID=A0ABM8RVW8_9BACT|nr:conserved hypothetical protein [Nitrospira defluvii]